MKWKYVYYTHILCTHVCAGPDDDKVLREFVFLTSVKSFFDAF